MRRSFEVCRCFSSLSEWHNAERIPASVAASPHNPPLHEWPSIASRDSAPGPVNASVKAATDRTNVYSKPPLVMKKPCFMCALKAATIITAKIIAADKGVTNPEARRTPPADFGQCSHQRVVTSRLEPKRHEKLPFFFKSLPAKPPEQHLCAMCGNC